MTVDPVQPVSPTELMQALDDSRERALERESAQRDSMEEYVDKAVDRVETSVRRDIKLYCALGVMGGQALVAVIAAKLGPQETTRAAVSAVRVLVGL